DFAFARDLNLAGYAIRASPAEALRLLADALTLVGRTDHSERIRDSLRRAAGENAELTAFEAAAREQPIFADPQHLAEQLKQIESKSDPADLSSGSSGAVVEKLACAKRWQMLTPSVSIEWLENVAIDKSPLSAAKQLLARVPNDSEALRACQLAARRAAEYQARSRLELIMNESSTELPSPVLSHEPEVQIRAAAEGAAAAGFEEPLRLYFQLLSKPK